MAKAESRLFIFTELAANILYLLLSIIGYKAAGLVGLGIAFTVDYLIYAILVYIIAAKRYGFVFSREFSFSFTLQLLLVGGALAMILMIPSPAKYWLCALASLISCVYALFILERKTRIFEMIKERIHNG